MKYQIIVIEILKLEHYVYVRMWKRVTNMQYTCTIKINDEYWDMVKALVEYYVIWHMNKHHLKYNVCDEYS